MARYKECDICGKRFFNGDVPNVVSFFEATVNKSETIGALSHMVLNAADPRYELCDDCFELARNAMEGMRATGNVLQKAAIYRLREGREND